MTFSQQTLTAWVDAAVVLTLDQTLETPMSGQIGLWVEIGTQGWIRTLRVTKS